MTTNSHDKVRKERKALGMTQEGLARRADCSLPYIQQLDAGYVPVDDAPKYKRVLEVLQEVRDEQS